MPDVSCEDAGRAKKGVMTRNGEHEEEPIEQLADEAIEENPDDQTRREAFELELMEEGRSKEGEGIDLEDEAEHHDEK